MKCYLEFLSVIMIGCCFMASCAGKASNSEQPVADAPENYRCFPCGLACDTILHPGPGTCNHCQMELVPASTIIHTDILPADMCTLDEERTLFLDVRTAAEFNGTAPDKFGAIRNAVNIPVQELESRIKELEKFREKDIVVYCSHSHRSPRASYMLTRHGFKKVTNMSGGMSTWKETVTDTGCNHKLYRAQ